MARALPAGRERWWARGSAARGGCASRSRTAASTRSATTGTAARPSRVSVLTDDDPDARPAALPPRPEYCFPLDPWAPQPLRRPDGLVSERPDDAELVYDDPMYDNYRWVAMLDPVELADGTAADGPVHDPSVRGVDVVDLVGTSRAGRETVEATVRPTADYDPRCSCCPLLFDRVAAGILLDEGGPSPARQAYPEAFRVALDVATGIVVSVRDLGGDEDGSGFDVTIHDADLVAGR
ncbi:hypothetical protein CLV30_105143 [Haloactinopolyspora alba]|uniref:Uncharacterized protein n=1 Tax=Haloactinopolyspora alba TaxID=648780 RepID=A0A2P8E5I2_9ACTN|nr:hypothetical protein [Haloactinopolyspora alba]PSL04677.1 hypothetical protein CLV30_105143 [Haloactinopolyspora alba]